MKTLVFGATGQTGIHIVRHAIEAKDDVYVFVRNASKIKEDVKDKVHAIEGTMTDAEAVSKAVREIQPDSIIIASAHVKSSQNAPLNYCAVPAIVKVLQELGTISTCRLLFLGGLFTPPKEEPLGLVMKATRYVFVSLAYNWAAINDNIDTVNYLLHDAKDTGLPFTIIRMGIVKEEPTKGTLVPDPKSAFSVTFDDMGLFLVKLAHGEFKDETIGKAIKVAYH